MQQVGATAGRVGLRGPAGRLPRPALDPGKRRPAHRHRPSRGEVRRRMPPRQEAVLPVDARLPGAGGAGVADPEAAGDAGRAGPAAPGRAGGPVGGEARTQAVAVTAGVADDPLADPPRLLVGAAAADDAGRHPSARGGHAGRRRGRGGVAVLAIGARRSGRRTSERQRADHLVDQLLVADLPESPTWPPNSTGCPVRGRRGLRGSPPTRPTTPPSGCGPSWPWSGTRPGRASRSSTGRLAQGRARPRSRPSCEPSGRRRADTATPSGPWPPTRPGPPDQRFRAAVGAGGPGPGRRPLARHRRADRRRAWCG